MPKRPRNKLQELFRAMREVTFDLEQPRSLKVRWEDHLSEQIQSSTKLSTAFENQAPTTPNAAKQRPNV